MLCPVSLRGWLETSGRIGVAVVLLAAAASHVPAQARDTLDEHPEVRQLRLLGADHVDKLDLSKSIATQESRCKTPLLAPFCLFTRSPTFVEAHFLDREELQRDVLRIRAYYWRHGFRDTKVDTAVTANGDGVTVTFGIDEGEPTIVSVLRVDYDSSLISQRRMRGLVLLRTGQPLDLVKLDSTRLKLRDQMWDLGYADAVVDTALGVNPETRRAAVLIHVWPNWPTKLGNIVVQGNERVDTRTILNMVTMRPGDPFRRNDVLESQRNLFQSNLFRVAAIQPPTGDSIKSLEIRVVEAPLRAVHVGGGLNNVDFGQIEARYSAFNLWGGARRLDVTTSFGNLGAPQLNGQGLFRDVVGNVPEDEQSLFLQPTWQVSADLRQPSFLQRPRHQAGISIFAHRTAQPGIYVDRGYGAAGTYTYQLAERAPLSLTYRFEITRLEADDIYFCVNYGVCDTATITTLRAHQKLSPVSLSMLVDRSDQPLNPMSGYVARADLEYASSYTLSDYHYARGAVDAAAYWHAKGRRDVFAAHIRLGLAIAMAGTNGDTVLHPRKRFYAGGAMSVRGYGENQLGPRVLTIPPESLRITCPRNTPIVDCNPNVPELSDTDFEPRALGGTSLIEGSIEWRYPIFRKLEGAIFVDGAIVGQAKLQGFSDLSAITNLSRNNAAITPGFGIRYLSPVGPVRADIGINPRITEALPVVTEDDSSTNGALVPLNQARFFSTGGKTFISRLVLHFSIGQAF